MFALLKRSKYDARPAFQSALSGARNPAFYAQYGVPDTFDGRFDALLLHLWPLFKVLEADVKASQALYDLTFKRMELALRETGVGDLGVGRQVRLMMKAYYGRLEGYSACVNDDDRRAALRRNLYGTVAEDGFNVPDGMVAYMRSLAQMQVSLDDLARGDVRYPPL